ncbi:hypothetical protein [Waltera intestinalis]|nr:hypothetical protein [Waltera intestinalis]
MKKKTALFITGMMLWSLTACGATEELPSPILPEATVTVETTEVSEENTATEEVAASEETTQPQETENTDDTAVGYPEMVEDSFTETGLGTFEDTWAMVQRYGFGPTGYSTLTYALDYQTLCDAGDYYEVSAVIYRGVKASGDLKVGDNCQLETDALTHTYQTFTYKEVDGEGYLVSEDGLECYYKPSADGSPVTLYCDSDDRVECPFYNGTMHIRKDAITGVAITNEISDFTKDTLTEESAAFNGIAFDENGQIKELIYFGD